MPAAKFTKDYAGIEELINQLTEAILQKKTCLITYHSFADDRIKDFSINPLHFYEREGGLYIFIQTTGYGDVITLAVDRIQSLVITSEYFEYPAQNAEDSFKLTVGNLQKKLSTVDGPWNLRVHGVGKTVSMGSALDIGQKGRRSPQSTEN